MQQTDNETQKKNKTTEDALNATHSSE